MVNEALAGSNVGVRGALHGFRPPLYRAGTADPGEPDPDPVLGPLRTAVDGTGQDNPLFRWFGGLGIDDPVWVPTGFTKNRDRLLTTAMWRKVMAAILAHREVAPLLSDDHFPVDGTPVKAWASMKSFQPKTVRWSAPWKVL